LKHFLKNIFFYANVVAALALLVSYLAPFTNPADSFIPAFFGLFYPVFLLTNILFLIYWVAAKNWNFLLSALVILIGWSHFSGIFQISYPEKKTVAQNEIKILSYNVRLFDLYNWSNNVKTRNEIFKFIKDQDADILCFQEFYQDDSKAFETLDTLLKFQKANNAHTDYSVTAHKNHHFGIATFSKYPIITRGKINLPKTKNISIYTDILVNEDTLRIYNNHLESIHFQEENYNFIDSITYKNEEERIDGIKKILRRLKNAYIKRSGQTEIISEHINNSKHPVLVCGDFNDTPVSYTYNKMSQNLNDAFKESGIGFGSTYNQKFFMLRIDYLLYSPEIKFRYFKTLKKKYSDHYPLVGIFEIQKTSN